MIPDTLTEQLRYIEIYTLKAVRDHRVGDYQSPLRGQGFAFDQHKRYQQGDDYRRIDWNVTARMQQPYVKKAFEDKEMSVVVAADLSRSMAFGSGAHSKKDLLLNVVATLAFSAHRDNMAVGLLGFTDRIELDLPVRKGRAHVWKILDSLWDYRARSVDTDFSAPLMELQRRLKRSSVILFLSDFIAPQSIFESRVLKHLVQKHDFVPVILQDPWEQECPPAGTGLVRLRDVESGDELLVNLSGKQAQRYAQLMHERTRGLQQALYRLNLDHLFVRPDTSYLDSLLGFFLARRRRRK